MEWGLHFEFKRVYDVGGWVGIKYNGGLGFALLVGAFLLFGWVCITCNGEMGFPV